MGRSAMKGVATRELSRRAFLVSSALAAGGFAIGISTRSMAAQPAGSAGAAPGPGEVGLNAWVRIHANNTVVVVVSQAEMGQGISTTLPAVLVDELGADWSQVRLETAPYDPAYANPRYKWMFTGNSESIQAFYDLMRTVGAGARSMLLEAAGQRWQLPVEELRASDGYVVHPSSKRRASFGELAVAAARVPPPAQPILKKDAELSLIGRSLPRVDIPAKVDGSAVFGIDYRVPGMLYAAVRTRPGVGLTAIVGNVGQLMREPGVVAVVPVDGGVSIVARTFWQARRALLKAELGWTADGTARAAESADMGEHLQLRLRDGPFRTPVNEGDALGHLAHGRSVERSYENPFLAHATMEPMNCVAHVTDGRCVVWAPTQGQNLAWYALQSALGLKGDAVQVHRTPYLGGGFGRRLLPDFVVQTALISRAVNAPVKLIWDREEDIRRDSYRPATGVRLRAVADEDGLPMAVAATVVSPTIISPVAPFLVETIRTSGVDPSAMEGMSEWPYAIEHRRVDFHLLDVPVPTSVMRTTGYGPNIFALESFLDEWALEHSLDPFWLRRRLLRDNPRAVAVLDRAAELAPPPLPTDTGEGLGIAFAHAFGSYIAQVVRVRVTDNRVRVLEVVSVVDPGRVIDPNISTAAIEGGVIFGLAGCKSQITFSHGVAEQDNFDTYVLPYLAECPRLVTEFIQGGGDLGGIGEVSPVTVAPALANAISRACGRRLRALPISRSGLAFG